MKKITELWSKVKTCLHDLSEEDSFNDHLYDKFNEIFELKDAQEYKAAAAYELYYSPQEFQHTSVAIKRALVEGYVLAQAERRKLDIEHLYSCYKEKLNADKSQDDTNVSSPALSRWFDTKRHTDTSR